ncbi:hypothetical protein LG634_35425 [Streptomyces bambusae]|uniref:hypothetical protein n=1 Tax=Streptomyces bambusae TaxID=1550616 RepID=UPI001CFF86A4|nr:hypothetical protein [Streptomyces bambusae]MCB5170082.1 hypothetical protein [Streptomyces bambusae]
MQPPLSAPERDQHDQDRSLDPDTLPIPVVTAAAATPAPGSPVYAPPLGGDVPDYALAAFDGAGAHGPAAGGEPERPVFVDASGRRQRRVRRIGRLLVVPAAAYVVVLVSTLLGGPTLDAPFLPAPKAERRAVPAKTEEFGAPNAGLPGTGGAERPAAEPVPDRSVTDGPAPSRRAATPSAGGGASPDAGATATSAPTVGPGPSAGPTLLPAKPGRGAGTPPGQARKPSARP